MTPADDEREPDGGDPDEGPILAPEELNLEDSEHVERIDDSRYVVSPDASGPSPDPGHVETTTADDGVERGADSAAPEIETTADDDQPDPDANAPTLATASQAEIHGWLADRFDRSESRYGFDVTAKFDGSVSQRRMMSNDVVTIFESLILWYAQQIDEDTPVEEILGILLMESNVPIRYPPASLQGLVESSNLDPDDSIADLLAAVESDDGVKL